MDPFVRAVYIWNVEFLVACAVAVVFDGARHEFHASGVVKEMAASQVLPAFALYLFLSNPRGIARPRLLIELWAPRVSPVHASLCAVAILVSFKNLSSGDCSQNCQN